MTIRFFDSTLVVHLFKNPSEKMVLRTLSKSALERAPPKNKINPMNTPYIYIYITLVLIKVHMALILDY